MPIFTTKMAIEILSVGFNFWNFAKIPKKCSLFDNTSVCFIGTDGYVGVASPFRDDFRAFFTIGLIGLISVSI